MRGNDEMQEALFTMMKREDFVPSDHPLRPIREIVNKALADHSVFSKNRDRRIEHEAVEKFFGEVMSLAGKTDWSLARWSPMPAAN